MPLPPGRRFGPYEILELVGTGGMGEVYRARDTRLDRIVAVKVLGAAASDRPSARSRFEREARAISRLSHPHICAVYDIGCEDGIDYIVMEYLQGENLARRLLRRAIRLDQALQHAVEIASALDEAHRAGIIHRDLKPSNVMLTPSGAKLLDFGLAKLRADAGTPDGASSGPTPDALTAEGVLVGTLPYMSPEQVEGKGSDVRTDIFSFGAMLHEMLTHRRAFDGGSQAALIAAILSSEPPPPSSLQPRCSPELDHLVARCLAKDPDDRWQSARDLLLELKWHVGQERERARPARGPGLLGWLVAAALAAVLLVGAFLRRGGEEPLPNASPHQVTMSPGWESAPALSPDGSLIAYASDESGNPDVWIVDVRGGNALRLTDDPAPDTDPAWFPDGSAVAFTSERGGHAAIWKVLRLGGAASLLVPDAEDAAIAPDGRRIAFSRAGPTGEHRIWVAPLDGSGPATRLTSDGDGFRDHRHPAFSPDGRRICYQAHRDLWLVPAGGPGAWRLTKDDEADVEPSFSGDGRYVYFSSLRGGASALWRVPSGGGQPRRLTLGTGPERQPSLSRDGRRLAYSTFSASSDLTLLDLATRKESRFRGLSALSPAFSPDGRSLVFASARIGGRFDLWIQPVADLQATGPPRRLTDQTGSVAHPVFSPDGRWVAYYRVIAGQRDVWTVPVAGGDPIRFTDDPAADIHPCWSPDGTQLAFASERGGASRIWVAPVVAGHPAGPARRLTPGPTADDAPSWSPDGRWIAYIGGEPTGKTDVWVVEASGSGAPRMLATEGSAGRVAWDRTSKALFVSGEWESWVGLRKYSLDTGARIPLDPPMRFGQNSLLIEFDISRDGRVVACGRDELRGDIWALESMDRSY